MKTEPNTAAADGAPGQNTVTDIVVNGRPRQVTGHKISYRQVVQLAFPDDQPTDGITYTVAYANPHGKDGTLTDGEETNVKEGMVFNVRKTNRS